MKPMKHLIGCLALASLLTFGLVACGGNNNDSTASTRMSAEVEKKASAFIDEQVTTYGLTLSPESELTLVDSAWSADPAFDEILAVSALAGITPYQGAATDKLKHVDQLLHSDYSTEQITQSIHVALNDANEVVLGWIEWNQPIDDGDPIRAIMSLSWDSSTQSMRFNDLRAANGLPPLSLDTSALPEASTEQAPVQNTTASDPENMTDEEQAAYAAAQENDEINEESADSTAN